MDMIERGAAALAARRRELIAQPLDRIWPDLMRAAIEAMREPTPRMVEDGCDNNPTSWNEGTTDGFASDVANDVYRAMIGAALKVQP